MDPFQVTLGQLVLTSPAAVYDQIRQVMEANLTTDLFVFPEFATQHQVDLEVVTYLQENPSARETAQKWLRLVPGFSRVQALCDRRTKAVIIGSLAQDGGNLHSRAYFYDPLEQQLAWYDKSHVHWTEDFLRPGDRIEALETRFGTIGMLICYDMAFVEATRVLGLDGADILFAISAVPMDFHWRYPHHRMIGAAIFNQFYVVAANLGHALPAPMGGYSGIYSPQGDLLAQIEGTGFGHLTAEIDRHKVRAWREAERVGPYRRPHLYDRLTTRGS
jgi:predicted amidohydrolase